MERFATVWRFVALVLVALLMGLAFAHALERPAKMQYPGNLYVTHWGPPSVGGILEPSAIIATAVLAFLVRRQRRAFRLTLLSLTALLLAFPIVFFWLVAPANATFRGAVGDAVPANWSAMRDSWELGHTVRFVLQLAAFGALVASALGRRPG